MVPAQERPHRRWQQPRLAELVLAELRLAESVLAELRLAELELGGYRSERSRSA